MTDKPKNELPEGWKVRRISEVAAVNPKVNKKEIPDDLLVSFVPMPAVGAEDGLIDVSDHRPFAEVKKGYTGFAEGDVLFAKITPCMENGKMAVVPPLANGYGFGSTEFHVLRPSEEVDGKYLYYYVSSKQFRGVAERHMSGAVGQRRVPTPYLKDCLIPVAPPGQQERIVAEIEKQFSRLDEAVANLKRVKANLKRYKAAVLKAAVEGKLTEEWRKAHPDVESASKLLDHILAERRAKWEEAELAKMEAKGKAPKNDKWKAKYKEPALSEPTNGPRLPAAWTSASLDQLTGKITSGSRDWSTYYGRGSSIFVLAQNVRPMEPDFSVLQQIDPPVDDPSCDRSRIQAGDLLTTIVGANTGQVCLVSRMPGDAFVCQSVALMRPIEQSTSAFINLWMNSTEHGQRYFERCMYGQGRPHLSFDQLKAMPIGLPPLEEQNRIVIEVERYLSLIHETETQVDANLQRAARLRQGILGKAYSGHLALGSRAASMEFVNVKESA